MLQCNDVSMDKHNTDNEILVEQFTSYMIDGQRFDVERIFKNDASCSLGALLLRLIKAEIEPL